MAAKQLEREIKTLKKDLQRLQSEFGKLAKDTGSAARTVTGSAARTVSEAAQEVGSSAAARVGEEASKVFDRLKDVGQSAVGGGEIVVTEVRDQVEEHPFIAIAAAIALGFLVAMLVARRR